MDICAIIRPGCIQAESDRENALVSAKIEHGRQLREVGQSVKKQADDTKRCHSAVMQGEIEAALPLPEEALVGGGAARSYPTNRRSTATDPTARSWLPKLFCSEPSPEGLTLLSLVIITIYGHMCYN